MRRKQTAPDEQGSLFGASPERPPRAKSATATSTDERTWKMPETSGKTVAEIRLRWTKRLTPAQVARVESELGRLPAVLTKLGFGPVQVERTFVRRRKN